VGPNTVKKTYQDVEFDIRTEGAAPKFLFGVRKSGSSIMNSMLAAVAGFNNVNYVDVAGKLFGKGVTVRQWQHDTRMAALLSPGNVYGGFRNAPLGLLEEPLLKSASSILLVRDPRDALVSEYFSNAFAHSIPESGGTRDIMLAERARAQKASIRDFVVSSAARFKETLQEYAEFLALPGLRLYRYEEAIMDKRWFLRDVCGHFDWTVTDQQLDMIMGWADVMPTEEASTAFIRKVVPGDHKDKCDAETIALLNSIFADEIQKYRYTP
jgi:hypothetical protein